MDDSLSLGQEFPELQDKVEQLRVNDQEFSQIMQEYYSLDRQIKGLETRDVPTSDTHFEDLKKQRLLLKDTLYFKLTHA
ncbi:YdcH family protein [Dongshaea marina]|uniref:YdcH family protein n=1 Tax=Dongshaea marina TaxID=2047966 RepID=UPI000D3EB604|nr:DUF465 domain-containing protein [Dongshaea marina]